MKLKVSQISFQAVGSRPKLPTDLDDILEEIEDETYEKILALFYACTEEDPEKRPSAEEVIKILNDEE